MAGRVYLEMAYLAPRAAAWFLLFLVGFVDGIRHRSVRSRGYQLYWALVVSAFLFVIQELILVIMAAESNGQEVSRATLGAYIFFADLAASFWFGILLAVAAGFCITRTSLGPHKPVVVAIPIVYLISSLVVDYVLWWIRGFDAFTDQPTYYEQVPEDAAEKVGSTTGFIYLICLLANTMAMLLAWFFIFDTIQKEKDILEQGYPDPSAGGSTGMAGGTAGMMGAAGSRELPVSSAGGRGAGDDPEGTVGHQAVLLEDGGLGPVSHMYVDVVEADLDAPKTFQDRVDDRDKLRLIRRFFFGVCAYLVATIAVLFLPLFVPTVVDRTLLVLQNLVLLAFLGALLWTFRMRQGSPYLLMDEEGVAGEAPTTELGVLAHDDDDELEGGGRFAYAQPAGMPPASTSMQAPLRGAGGPGGARFTLSDEEGHTPTAGGSASADVVPALPPPRRVTISTSGRQESDAAFRAGVVVEPLPTPATPAMSLQAPLPSPGR